jgi:hypothetical protein
MNHIDVATNTITLAALYRAHIAAAKRRGDTQEEAEEFAQAAVTRAHATLAQPSLSVSRSPLEQRTSSNPWLGFITMFMSEIRKTTANNFVAWRNAITGKGLVSRKRAARQMAVYTVGYTAAEMAARTIISLLTGDDEKREESLEKMTDPKFWVYAMMSNALLPIPILGDAAMSMLADPLEQKYWEKRNPIVSAVSDASSMNDLWEDDMTPSEMIDEAIDQTQAWGGLIPGGPLLSQVANLTQFAKDVYENGLGKDLSEEDQVKRLTGEILQNKRDIYEKYEENEEKREILTDVLKQYREEYPDKWDKILEELQSKDEDGNVKLGADKKPLYKVSREVIRNAGK